MRILTILSLIILSHYTYATEVDREECLAKTKKFLDLKDMAGEEIELKGVGRKNQECNTKIKTYNLQMYNPSDPNLIDVSFQHQYGNSKNMDKGWIFGNFNYHDNIQKCIVTDNTLTVEMSGTVPQIYGENRAKDILELKITKDQSGVKKIKIRSKHLPTPLIPFYFNNRKLSICRY